MIYLACPYSDPNPLVRQMRFTQVCHVAARLMLAGNVVFSPIAHSHPIETLGMTDIKDGEFWMAQDLPLLALADKLMVLKLPGWERSKGLGQEIAFALGRGIHVEYIDVAE